MPDRRPDPDQMLARAKEEEIQQRGKLKIYLGSAPGVGKTYTMLEDALTKRSQGLDIVAGVVESHGRKEIERLLKGLEILPRKTVIYHEKSLLEFDLDGALSRNPGLILMDEMAHTNIPGLRHEKRWQDIKELLDRGIDVYTTLNVQHIESLNDVVTQIIGIKVRETVPDSVLGMADTIELIDLPPDDLLKRLQDGKVYFPAQAKLATQHFFRKGNLIALRELALRFTAEHVNEQVLLHRRGQGIEQTWPTTERLLVCVGSSAESTRIIRAAKRMSTSLHADWIAVYVEIPHLESSAAERNAATQNLRLAEQLGAETRILNGLSIAKEIINFAREQNITKIVMGKPVRPLWRHFLFGSLGDEVARASGDIDIYMIHGDSQANSIKPIASRSLTQRIPVKMYGLAFVGMAITTGIGFLLYPYLGLVNVIMLYLLSIVLVSLYGKVGPAIFASCLAVATCDFLFIPPRFSFFIDDLQYFFTLVIMLVVAQIISHLTILTRRHAEIARLNEKRTAALHALTRQLAVARGIDKLIEIGARHVANVFNSDVVILLPEGNHLVIRSGSEKKKILTSKEHSVAQWVYDMGQVAGLGTDTLPFSDAIYIPLMGSRETVGVLKVHPKQVEFLLIPEQLHLLEAYANQIAVALEVDRLQEKARGNQVVIETERLRTALLNSLSNELQQPLFLIGNLIHQFTEQKANVVANPRIYQELIDSIAREAERLARLIENLIQITRLEEGEIKLHKQLNSLADVINATFSRLEKKVGDRACKIQLPPNLMPLLFDKVLMEQVFVNLIENAVIYSPSDKPIEVTVTLMEDGVLVAIADYGPGLTGTDIERIFDKFYRGQYSQQESGAGLGLSICQSIIKAHNGRIWAENRSMTTGAIFYFILPLANDSISSL
jgi:two-component system sensor histidine kinase KdpD